MYHYVLNRNFKLRVPHITVKMLSIDHLKLAIIKTTGTNKVCKKWRTYKHISSSCTLHVQREECNSYFVETFPRKENTRFTGASLEMHRGR